MRIQMDARIRTQDGHDAGRVRRAVIDPATNEVREFVVSTGGLLGHDVVVSRDVLEQATAEGDVLVVALSKDELGSLDRYDEKAYAPPPYGWMAPASYSYPTAAFLLPVDATAGPAFDDAPRRRPSIKEGMSVRDSAGNEVGTVKELRLDDMTGELRSVLLRSGEETREITPDEFDLSGDELHLIDAGARSERRT